MFERINLAIPIAGKSKRFKKEGFETHKAFLELKSSFVLKEIIDTFPKDIFNPIVICTQEQRINYESYFQILLETYPNLIIKSIKSHNFGPTYSLRQIEIDDNSPIVIHYCDFLVDMNLQELIDGLIKGLICAPYFQGFHPASLGTTTFGYMKLDSNNYLITLKEKSSFTNNRLEEPCSTGIYAFPSFQIFKELADILLEHPNTWGQSEAYTSLCMNIAVEKGYKVFGNEVKKFICLGTPRDYKEYLYWYFLSKSYTENSKSEYEYEHHILTAAGKGNRFRKYGYRIPKIFLDFQNKSLLEQAFTSINSKKTTIISLKSYEERIKRLNNYSMDIENFFIDQTLNGQLFSLFEYIKLKKIKNFLVSSADYNFSFSNKEFNRIINEKNPDIIIFTTSWNEFAFENISNYGFVESNSSGLVKRIIEKPSIKSTKVDLNSLLIGTFWFKSSEIIDSMMKNNNSKEELFIAKTISNYLSKFKTYRLDVNYWLSLGTPKEYQLAQYWFDYFLD